jgi:tetratricopeptide (TPR) repeat protein
MAIAHNEIGLIQEELGFFDLSIIHFENSIENLKKLNETQKVLKVYNNIANVLYLLRDIEKSYEYYEKALNLAEQENLISEQIKIASNLIEILFLFKSYDRTERIIERNLLYFKQVGDPKGIIITLIKKGKLNYFLGLEKYDVSQKVFNEAIELIDKIESTQNFTSMDKARLQWECFFYLGNIELLRNDYEKAENLFLTSLKFINSSKIEDNDVNESLILEALAKLYESKGDYQRSIEYYKLSERIYFKFGNDAKQAEIKNIIAHIYLNFANNDSEAINYFEQALDIYEKANHMKESADIIQELGDFYANKEIDELALSYFQKARNYFIELNDEYNVKILTEKINSLTN